MIVVADTGPINYLILIGHADVLQHLYGEVIIPPAVEAELFAPAAPAIVREWIDKRPSWIEVRTPGQINASLPQNLGAGEREAISLVETSAPNSLLLIDEWIGREHALRLGLEVVGTLGVLLQSHHRGLLDLRDAFLRLRATNFRAPETLYQQFLDRI